MFVGLLHSPPDGAYAGPARCIWRPGTPRGVTTPREGKQRLGTLVGEQQLKIVKVNRLDEMSIETGLL